MDLKTVTQFMDLLWQRNVTWSSQTEFSNCSAAFSTGHSYWDPNNCRIRIAASKYDSYLSACFSQPTAVCIDWRILFVADTAVEAIRMITPTNSLHYVNFWGSLICYASHLAFIWKERKVRFMLMMKQLLPWVRYVCHACVAWVKEVQDKRRQDGSWYFHSRPRRHDIV